MGKIVRFYQAEDGKTPVKDFLDSLPGKVAQKTPAKEIERAETYKGDYLRRHKRHE
jgi:hypothetical protein